MKSKRIIGFLTALVMAFTVILGGPTGVNAETEPGAGGKAAGHLIHQVYGGGGKSDTAVSHSFVELYNPTDKEVSLKGYRLVYLSSRTAGNDGSTGGAEVSLDLNDVVIPKQSSYLVRGAAEVTTSSTFDVNTFDQEWAQVIDNKQYVLKLTDGQEMVDGVSVGEDPVEGTVITGISKQKAVRRIGFSETDNNGKDFEIVEYKGATAESINAVRPRSLADGPWPAEDTEEETPDPTEPTPPEEEPGNLNTISDTGFLSYLGSYSTGTTSGDGGVAEIVKYNPDNQKMYMVSGAFQGVDVVSLKKVVSGEINNFSLEKRIDIETLASAHGFTSGDITSIDVNTARDLVAVSVQASGYKDNGSIVFLDYDGNYITHVAAGVQPDMVVFTKDGNYVLSANEGEPREGYDGGAVDPKGSVTIVKLKSGAGKEMIQEVKTVDFTSFDDSRQSLVDAGVLIKPETAPSVDLEPEYIAISQDGKTAYVSLQEANAIATLDIVTGQFTKIKGLGFKDHSAAGNELDLNNNGEIKIQNEEVLGVFLPDGIATVNIGGTQYVLTANEGDAREWGSYKDIGSKVINGSAKKVEYKLPSAYDGLEEGKTYLLGGRSFSIWNGETMEQVYDSGSDFERITARIFPKNFNANHKATAMEGRSNKKGPEPEDIQTLAINGKTYAVIGLERIGGVMIYDISHPAAATYVDYINIRDFSHSDLAGGSDLGAEGISVVEVKDSPTGRPMILVANEVSGTVTVLEVNVDPIQEPEPTDPEPEAETGWVDQEKDPKKETTKPSDTAEHKGAKGEAGTKAPKTGDDTPVALMLVLLLVAAGTGVTMGIRRKKLKS